MKSIWTVAKREINSYFDSLIAYILIIAFLILTGIFTWLYGSDIFLRGEASLQAFFSIAYWALFFFIPPLTMRLVAEEWRSGTLELILTKPVSEWQFLIGKFLAVFILITVILVLTIPYYITVASIGPIDHGAVITGYFGLLFMSAAYISIGIFSSSLTSNQIGAVLLAYFLSVFFHLLFGFLGNNFTGILGNILDYLSTSTHYESITRGVIDSKDIIYFVTLVLAGLFGSELVLVKRNMNN